MKSPSLDKLYTQLHKHIVLAQSYTEFTNLALIIQSCRLKPNDYVFRKKSLKTILYSDWFDEYGNSLHFNKKTVSLVYGDLSLDRDKIVNTDLYYGLSLDRVIKMSKMAFICLGVDEDLLEDCFFLTFLGLDNYFRSYLFLHGDIQQVSSLLLGLDTLQMLVQHIGLQYSKKLDSLEKCPLPCQRTQAWLSCLPLSSALVSDIRKHSDKLTNLLEITSTTHD
jgi:hypothetical protein